jgi:hypothetical protein
MKLSKIGVTFFLGMTMWCSVAGAQSPTSAGPAAAAVPRLVNFSGKSTDPQGKAIAGIAGATFSIYKEQSEGSPLWMETQNIHADAKGTFTVQLGAGSSQGLPVELFAGGEARWLGVRIDGGLEQPRTLLLSVPDALKAVDADTLGGKPLSAFLLATQAANPDAARSEGQIQKASRKRRTQSSALQRRHVEKDLFFSLIRVAAPLPSRIRSCNNPERRSALLGP